jgi:hypothetical protein
MRTFKLNRKTDKTGTSGTGLVAVGLEDSLGRVFLAWIVSAKLESGESRMIETVTAFRSIDDIQALHGHGGASQVEIDQAIDLNTVKLVQNRVFALVNQGKAA